VLSGGAREEIFMSRTNEPRMVASGATTSLWPRALNAILGGWLAISAFAWPHARWQFINTFIPGILIVAFALAACAAPRVRYLNTVVSAYLLVSALCYPSTTLADMATQWNNSTVALWILLISVIHERRVGTASTASVRARSTLSA
jgi:hypothetical protein